MVLYLVCILIGVIIGAVSCSIVRSLQLVSARASAAQISKQRAMLILAQMAQRHAV